MIMRNWKRRQKTANSPRMEQSIFPLPKKLDIAYKQVPRMNLQKKTPGVMPGVFFYNY